MALALALPSLAAMQTVVPKGTNMVLVFDRNLNSQTAKVGQVVPLHVRNNVFVNGREIVRAGTPVRGVIEKVRKRKAFGVNGDIRLALNSVRTTTGAYLPLEARSKGKEVAGKKSGEAAAATAGGAVVLGPVGLIGGYFIHGKPVRIHRGDTLDTGVSRTVVLRSVARGHRAYRR